MSKEEILNYFYTNNTNLGVMNILSSLFGGLIIGFIIFITYKVTHKEEIYNEKYNWSLVMILLICIVVMLMISSNIVISLGMVGALSIVRFRTAIKDSRDTVFMFWAIAEGLCVGCANFKLAIITTLFIAIATIIFSLVKYINNKYLLIIIGDKEHLNKNNILTELDKYVLKKNIKNVITSKTSQEIIVEIKTKGTLDINLVDEISKIDGVNSVNFINESEENIG